ncbi:MAG: HAD family hydrolase [Clostridia bacterium]|nr:HAD family hydrolase [Clostridia bacterium]
MFDGLIFDLDGTLWDATKIICKTWNVILKEYPKVRKEPVTVEELKGCMGLQIDEIGRKLFKESDEGLRKELMDKCCVLECEYLSKEGGELFDDVEKTLKILSQKYKLYIVSNCQNGYIESFYKGNGLGKYFKDKLCAEETGLSKGENNKIIIKRNNLKNPVYIGDTQGDRQSAADAGIPFVYAEYGFGNVDSYDFKIEKFSDLADIM